MGGQIKNTGVEHQGTLFSDKVALEWALGRRASPWTDGGVLKSQAWNSLIDPREPGLDQLSPSSEDNAPLQASFFQEQILLNQLIP